MLAWLVRGIGIVWIPLLAFGLAADRALVGQARGERDGQRRERSRFWSQSIETTLSRIERSIAEGAPVALVTIERLALAPRATPRSARVPYASRRRDELAALLKSYDATPSGLPEAVVAKIALGTTSVSRAGGVPVAERLLLGRLPVRPDDLPYLADALGVAADPRVQQLQARLRAAPPGESLPLLPRFTRRLSSDGGEVVGWGRTHVARIGYRLPVTELLRTAGLLERAATSDAEDAVPVTAVPGLRLSGVGAGTSVEFAALPQRAALWLAIVGSAIGWVTIRRAVVAETRAIAREKSFVAGVSHDLRTPLASIRLLGETLAGGRGDAVDYGRLVAHEADRLHAHVETVLAAARIDAAPQFAPCDPTAVLRSALRVIQPRAERAGVTIESRLDVSTPNAHWDEDGVRRALLGLLDNALVHGSGAIQVDMGFETDSVIFTISDAGSSMGAPRRGDRGIFGRFRRGETSRDGTGLGLYLVDEVARTHGGRVDLAPVDSGTTFALTLPLQPRANAGRA